MKNLHKILSNEPTKKGDITVGITLKIWDGEGDAPQHSYNLFITSDEEIKEGDWVITYNGLLAKVITEITWHFMNSKKVILTTDQYLINDGVQAIQDDFLEWFVNNPKCEEVEVEKGGILYDYKYKIIIPKQEITLEEAMDKNGYHDEVNDTMWREGVKFGAKWEQEQDKNKYSEEDVREAFRQGMDNMDYSEMYGWSSKLTEQEWFEQFKNTKR
jgi:hypothetical protein